MSCRSALRRWPAALRSSGIHRLLAVLCCAWGLLLSPVAFADDVEVAAETFKAGELAFSRRDFVPAAKAFEASYRLAPHGMAAYNAAIAWRFAGELPRAADAFARSLSTDGLTGELKDKAREQLKELRARVCWVTVQAPEGSRVWVAHLKDEPLPPELFLPPGAHTLRIVRPDGKESSHRVELRAGEHTAVTVATKKPPPPEPLPVPAPVTTPASPNPLLLVGGVLLGVGVVSGGAAIALGVRGLSARDAFEASAQTDQQARDEAIGLRTGTNIAWAAAGVFAVTGTVLLVVTLTGDDDDGEPNAAGFSAPRAGPYKARAESYVPSVDSYAPSVELYAAPTSAGVRGRF